MKDFAVWRNTWGNSKTAVSRKSNSNKSIRYTSKSKNYIKKTVRDRSYVLSSDSIALAQINSENNSRDLLNEIRQTGCSLYQEKQQTKRIYNDIMKSWNSKWIQSLWTDKYSGAKEFQISDPK